MQEALKNPHFKKIWETIIMNRHLEAKSLEEALEMEKEKDDCGLLLKDSIFTHNTVVGIKSANIALKTANLSYAKIKYIMGAEFKILGRPITLEDVMMILPRTFAYWNAYNSIVKVDFVNDNHYVIGYNFVKVDFVNGKHYVIGYNLEWQPTKPLDEQTPETWEKIANFID